MKRSYKIYVDDSMSEEELKKLLGDKIILAESDNTLPPPSDGKKLAEILQKIANEGGFESFGDDPVKWQKEQRKDRKLPFRD